MVTDEQFDFYVNEVRQMRLEMKEEINKVKTELIAETKEELRKEIAETKEELRQEIAETKKELRQEIALTRTELKAEITKGRKETMDLREDYLEELARNSQQHIDIIKLMQSKIQDLDERKADKELKTA